MEDKEQVLIEEFYALNGIDYAIPETVYHYTSADSLVSIIENNTLWFSDRKCMNDIMDSTYNEERIRAKFPKEFNQTALASRLSTPQYVFSTTTANDSFFHYSCYGNYCMAFNTTKLINYIKNCIGKFGPHEGIAHPFTYSKAIYDESIVEKTSSIIAEEYPKNVANELNTPYCSFKETEKWTIIYLHFMAIVKQKGFACEQEFRFLIETNKINKSRYNKTDMIPYLELKLSGVKLPIEAIMIGKSSDAKEIECIKSFLKKRHGDINILCSDLKIRAG